MLGLFSFAISKVLAIILYMHYLTRTEYAELVGITRQAVDDRIKRGKLMYAPTQVLEKRIPVEDREYERIKKEQLALGK